MRKKAIALLFLLTLSYGPAIVAPWLASRFQASQGFKPRFVQGRVVSDAEQLQTAYHEAGHALLSVYMYGNSYVGELKVWVKTDDNGFLGTLGWDKSPPMETTYDYFRRATVNTGGRAADKMVNGAPTDGSRTDLKWATEFLMPMRITYGLGGSLVVKPSPSDRDYEAINDFLIRANACSEAIVAANKDIIKALGARALEEKPVDNVRVMSGNQVREFFKDHPIMSPEGVFTAIEMGTDPCDFVPEL